MATTGSSNGTPVTACSPISSRLTNRNWRPSHSRWRSNIDALISMLGISVRAAVGEVLDDAVIAENQRPAPGRARASSTGRRARAGDGGRQRHLHRPPLPLAARRHDRLSTAYGCASARRDDSASTLRRCSLPPRRAGKRSRRPSGRASSGPESLVGLDSIEQVELDRALVDGGADRERHQQRGPGCTSGTARRSRADRSRTGGHRRRRTSLRPPGRRGRVRRAAASPRRARAPWRPDERPEGPASEGRRARDPQPSAHRETLRAPTALPAGEPSEATRSKRTSNARRHGSDPTANVGAMRRSPARQV